MRILAYMTIIVIAVVVLTIKEENERIAAERRKQLRELQVPSQIEINILRSNVLELE